MTFMGDIGNENEKIYIPISCEECKFEFPSRINPWDSINGH